MANHSTVKDTGVFFTITPETREVKVPSTHKIIGVVGDHLAEQLTFEIPRIIDGHDIAGCSRRYVEWENVDGVPGADSLTELTERPEGAQVDMLYFTWTIRDLLAAAKGLVQFSVHFEDVDENGVRLYHWGTTNCKNCEILDSINHTLGAYTAMWVAGDTLVIADYTPVDRGALALETLGIVPEGTLEIHSAGLYDVGQYAAVDVVASGNMPSGTREITANGTYDVAEYAQANVNVPAPTLETPTIKVKNTGEITATANGKTATYQLSSKDDAQLDPGCILRGETLFGVAGDAPRIGRFEFDYMIGSGITSSVENGVRVSWCKRNSDGLIEATTMTTDSERDFTVTDVLQGSVIVITPRRTDCVLHCGTVMNTGLALLSDPVTSQVRLQVLAVDYELLAIPLTLQKNS